MAANLSSHALRGDYAHINPDYTVAQPYAAYTDEQHDRWRRLYRRQMALMPRYALAQTISFTDPRIKAVATVSMYDIGQAHRQGLAENLDTAALKKNLAAISKQRWAEVDGAERTMIMGTPQKITEKSSEIDKEFYDYYRTPRGQHPRSSTAFWRTSGAQMMLFSSFEHFDWMSPRPVLFITGDHAHSRIFSEQAFKKASEPKELCVVPNAGHVDLYDRVNLIPWDKLTSFFTENLK